WQQVIVDRPEYLAFALILGQPDPRSQRLLGFQIQEGADLQTVRPAFALGGDWRETLPDLAEDPPLESWHQAWRSWCATRGFSTAEVQSCTLERKRPHLRVYAPRRLLEGLRTRSEVFRNEAWVLAGTGKVQAAAILEVKPAEVREQGVRS